jgi:hypothetical protein
MELSGSFRSIRTEGTNYAESVWEFRLEIRGEPQLPCNS